MNFTYNWLKKYVEFDGSARELAEKLTMAGVEVEQMREIGGGALEKIVVAQILSSEKHPNADKLSVCRVTDGKTERQIVCGAKNYKIGDKVPLALPGVTLPNGLTIAAAKLRGVESHGMLCSAKELALAEDAEGLLILPAETKIGITLTEALGGIDTIFEVEITPNRPDLLGVIGLAREVAAISGKSSVKLPQFSLRESGESVEKIAKVVVEAPDLCPRYTARVIRGVRIGPSPAWLRQILEKVGLRSINNVVDVTNFVLLECNQPLHAFDLNLLEKRTIVVRRAQNGERITAIDDSKHELSSEMLVIADAKKAVAIAGIMGGKESEINDATTDVLLESAYFSPQNVRRTRKRLGLSSESSYRFERGIDISAVDWASARAAALIQEVAGGEICRGVLDALAKPIEKRKIFCRFDRVNALLGTDVPKNFVETTFRGLGLVILGAKNEGLDVEIPTFRVDLEREVDLIEEIGRIFGVEKIASELPKTQPAVSDDDVIFDAHSKIREILRGLGFDEAVNLTLTNDGSVKLQNPLSADLGALRSDLTTGLLQNLRTNVSRGNLDVKLFEIGRVFAPEEKTMLAMALTGRREPNSWESSRETKLDFYDLKGAVEELCGKLGVTESVTLSEAKGLSPQTTEMLRFAPHDTRGTPNNKLLAVIWLDDKVIGGVAMISALQAKKFDLRDATFVAEIEVAPLLAAVEAAKSYRPLPKFPSVVRDMALVVDEGVTHEKILEEIRKSEIKFLESVALFDIFRSGMIAQGKKSMAYSLTFRAADRTLTDAEVNALHEEIKGRLRRSLQCEIRER
jgi:phenylalanyl-tRNA synthetase beta chain